MKIVTGCSRTLIADGLGCVYEDSPFRSTDPRASLNGFVGGGGKFGTSELVRAESSM